MSAYRSALSLVVLLILVACSNPSAQPPVPPTVNLTGTWVVTSELVGYTLEPFVWTLTQSGSRVRIGGPNPNIPSVPCGNETSRVQGNRWTYDASFNTSNCPILNPLSGRITYNVLVNANATAFAGSMTFVITDGESGETYRGRLIGARRAGL